jgi:hypothetical protein
MENLAEIVRRLHAADVKFVVIGGLAAVRHGASYVTYDVDICVPLEAENFRKIERAINDIHPRFRLRRDLPFQLTEEMLVNLKNLYLVTDLGPLDCLGEVKDIGDYSTLLEQSQLADFPFGKVQILKIPSLIRAKESIGRPQDMLVVTQLRAIQERLEKQKSN